MDMATVVEKTKVSMGATYGATFGKDRWE